LENLTNRYLMGIIKCGGFPSNNFILPLNSLRNDDKKILKALISVKDKDNIGIDTYKKALAEELDEDFANMYIENAIELNITKAQVMEIHGILISDYIKNQATAELKSLLHQLNDPEALDEALNKLRDLKALQPTPEVFVGRQMELALNTALQGATNIIPYGLKSLDRHVAGLNRKEVTVIAARPSHGKTSFVCQLVLNWLEAGYKICFFSKEMPIERVYHKFLSNICYIDSNQVKSGLMSDVEKQQLCDAGKMFTKTYKNQLRIYDNIYSVREMESIIAKERPDIVIDDFIQLTEMNSKVQVRLAILEIMKTYKNIAKEYNCAFITISQLNRNIENRDDPIPRLSDLAESGSIEQLAADVLFLFYGHKVDNSLSIEDVDLIASKTRYGTPGRVKLCFTGQYMRYEESNSIRLDGINYGKED